MSMQDDFINFQQRFPFSNIVSSTQGILASIVAQASALPNASEISADIAFVNAYIKGITMTSGNGQEPDFIIHMNNILTAAGFSPWASAFQPLSSVQTGLAFPPSGSSSSGSYDYPLRDAAPGIFNTIVANVPNLTPAMQARLAPLLAYYSDAIKNGTQVNMSDNTNYNKIMALLNGPQAQ